jgi:flagellar biosynthesis/type III secretory pathway chaperone
VIRNKVIGLCRRYLSRATPCANAGKPSQNANRVRVAQGHLANNPGWKEPMPSHDPTHCRERLATLMAEQNAQLAALENLLTHDYEKLQVRDVEGLERSGTERQQCVGHIARIEDERLQLCRAFGHGDDPAALHNLLTWCDPTGLLKPVMREYLELTRRCRERNDRNGILVNARLQRVPGMEVRTYGPGGGQASGYGRKLTTRA